MKKIFLVLAILILSGCLTDECSQWYSYATITPVTSINNGNRMIEGWYATDFLKDELNFEISFIYSADGYETCKSTTMIHEVVKDSIYLSCENAIYIGNEVLKENTNLIKYFDIAEKRGHMLFKFNKHVFRFPVFEQEENTFHVKFLLSDNKILRDSCIVKIIQ